MMLNQQLDYSFGVNAFGHVSGEYGMGQAIRSTIRAMETAKIPFVIRDFKVKWHRNLDNSYTEFSNQNPYPINLIHINPSKLLDSIEPEYFKNKYNIGFWAWELLECPQAWYSEFDLFDEIWTYSNYAASALALASPIPIFKMPLTIYLPKPIIGRKDLGLPQSKFIFLFMFDFRSTFARKNPLAVVKAFKKAFGDSRDVMLILKFSNADAFPKKFAELLKNIDNDKSIYTINKHLMKEEINGLINSCNCYISLHRAEGFGLTMAEAMFYGKPVISTGYSSNIEFMNVNNSFLVKYKLIKNPQDEGPYPKGCVWADPDIDHAAFLMKYVFENYEESQKIGKRAALDIRSILGDQAIGDRIKNRIDYIMAKINQSGSDYHIHQLKAEREGLIQQLQAWKETGKQTQTQLVKIRSQLNKLSMN
ncbi:MAG: glycosyltransferase [Limnospira sp. PMC 1279.21]|uniref:glycosyltransferase n=1 Tax=Limnospira sp. PMC 1279.21 TaxID=2981062 RepID=UPI0028E0B20A|nr:glycosyltransferase [Limnospira sp. PMC 1279.21]MDT9225501.1 glycosyltransferase [Limnospira sp. PMC 1279.21]